MRAKIIIFQNDEDNETWIHTDVPSTIMYFSRGFNNDEDLMLDLPDNNRWEFNGIIDEHAMSAKEFQILWSAGEAFRDDPSRIKKQEEKEHVKSEISKTEKNLKHLRSRLIDIDNE